jgi:hypothetical protein
MDLRASGFEEALGAEFDGVHNLSGGEPRSFERLRSQSDRRFRGPGQKKPHRPIAVNGMRAEECEGVGMVGGDERVDLRIEARIPPGRWRLVLHGGALVGQVHGLPDAANRARSGELRSES